MNAEQKLIFKSFIPPAVLVCFLWIIKTAEILIPADFGSFGVYPRTTRGLTGIITSPLIHGDFRHLISNSIPLLILGSMLIYFYKELAVKVFFWIYFLSGFWLWLGGRESYHIGASGLVYGLTAFLLISGLIRRHTGLMALSLLVAFLYGSIIWGIFPIYRMMSWEGHLFGLAAGIIIAIIYRKEGPQRKIYDYELEEEEDEISSPGTNGPMNIQYVYKKESPESESKNTQ